MKMTTLTLAVQITLLSLPAIAAALLAGIISVAVIYYRGLTPHPAIRRIGWSLLILSGIQSYFLMILVVFPSIPLTPPTYVPHEYVYYVLIDTAIDVGFCFPLFLSRRKPAKANQ